MEGGGERLLAADDFARLCRLGLTSQLIKVTGHLSAKNEPK